MTLKNVMLRAVGMALMGAEAPHLTLFETNSGRGGNESLAGMKNIMCFFLLLMGELSGTRHDNALQDSAVFFRSPDTEKSPFHCANRRASCRFQQSLPKTCCFILWTRVFAMFRTGLFAIFWLRCSFSPFFSKQGSTPTPLGAGSARPNPEMGAPEPRNPLFLGFSVLRGGLRPWSQTMVSQGARPWGRGRSGDRDFCAHALLCACVCALMCSFAPFCALLHPTTFRKRPPVGQVA